MPRLTTYTLLAAAALLQSTVGARIAVAEGRPNLVLLLVIAWAVHRGIEEGVVGGVVGGLLLDVLSGAPFGLNAIVMALVGLAVGVREPGIYRSSVLLLSTTAFLTTLGYHVLVYLGLQLMGRQLPSAAVVSETLIPAMLLNALLMPLVHWLLRRALRATSALDLG